MALGGMEKGELSSEALDYFLEYINQNQNNVIISDVKFQVVSGIMYYFIATINDKNEVSSYQVELWEQPWLEEPYEVNMKLLWKLSK